MTTNDGTPISATNEPWNAPMIVVQASAISDRTASREDPVPAAGLRELGDHDAADRR